MCVNFGNDPNWTCHDGGYNPYSVRQAIKAIESPHIEARHGQTQQQHPKKKKYKSLAEMMADIMPDQFTQATPAYAGIRKYGDEGGTDDLKTKATKFVVKKGKNMR